MNVLVLNAEKLIELATLNSTAPSFQKLEPVKLQDGRDVLNADLLTDMAPGGTWEHYAALLSGLPIESVAIEEFAVAEV